LTKLNRHIFLLFLSVQFLVQCNCVLSQTPYYYRISEENGLPSSEVYQIIQDDFGYIWIGCDAGLYRYDGIRFKSYNSKRQNSKSISGLKIDKDKNLWCQNFSGQIFRVSADSLTLVIDVSDKIASYAQYTVDKEHNVWIANVKTVEQYNFNGKKIQSLFKLNTQKDTIIWQEVEVNANGDVYLSSQKNGIAVIRKKQSNYNIALLDTSLTVPLRTALEQYGKGLVALSETNIKREYIISLVVDNNLVEKSRFYPFKTDGLIYKIYRDNLNRHWLCTSSGIVKLNNEFKLDSESKFFFNNDKISGVYQDREGNLWVSSLQNGIFVIPNYELNLFDEQSSNISDHNITALLKTNQNELLVGTYTGSVYKLNLTNSFELFPKQTDVAYRTVKKISESDGGIYVSHGPLSFYNSNKETVFNAYNFRDFCWLGDTLFYVSSSAFGFYPKVHSIPNDELGKNSIVVHNRGCKAIAIDEKNNTIYFASIDGLFKYKDGIVKEIKLNNKPVFANKLSFYNNQLWVGTVNEGLYILQEDKIKKHFHEGYVLHGNGVKSFKIINEYVYVSTEEGLTRINYNTDKSDFFDYTDGIVSKEINAIEYFNGHIFLATNKGLFKLPKNNIKNSVYPNIQLTGVFVNDSLVIPKNNILNLNYDQNNIDIEFNTACLKARGSFKYKYRILGLDANWHYNNGVNNHLKYALPSGEFTFEIRAVNEDGLESLNTLIIKVLIKSPFWQRWWFYLLSVLLGAGIVAVLFMVRIQFIKRRAELRNKVTASQLTALKSQMNPHFLFNTLNSLQDLILKHDIKNSNYYLNKFSILMREILDMSGKDEVILSREVKLLETYLELEKLRFGDEFEFVIHIDSEIDVDHLQLPPMIIQPFIENALKHGLLHKKGDKKLKVTFTINDNCLMCEIMDNGVGRKRSEEIKARSSRTHQSFATDATDKRMDLLNSYNDKKYSFKIIDLYEDEKSVGTKVLISIPI